MTPWRWKPLIAVLAFLQWCSCLHAAPFDGPEGSGTGANLAVVVEGNISIKRQGWTTYEPVAFGTNLRPGDLVRVDPSSHAKIVCSDLTVHELPIGIAGIPCTRTHEVLRSKDGSVINVTRSGPADGSFPVVLSPRKTKLLSPNPILQWTPVPGASAYAIAIRGFQFFWSARVSGTMYAYPNTAPRLKPGIDYKLIVQAADRSSSEESGFGLGFSILDDKERSGIEKEQQRIESLGLSDGPTQFLIAYLYASNGLRAEAIQRLEKVVTQMKAAAVSRLLGDLYLEISLNRRAEASYLQALDLCKDENDEEGQMLVHLSLAGIYEDALGNSQLAREHLNDTLVLAKKIGDEGTASIAGNKLAKLKKEGV